MSSITPDRGSAAGGTSVTIKGFGFLPGASVRIGGVNATSVVVVDSETITAKTPALPAGTLEDLVVLNPGGLTALLAAAWLVDFLDVPPSYLFYRSIGAIGMDEWRVQRVAGESLERLAAQFD